MTQSWWIAGSGILGHATALLCAQSGVTVYHAYTEAPFQPMPWYALSEPNVQLLERLGIEVKENAALVQRMQWVDVLAGREVDFQAQQLKREALMYIVDASIIRQALLEEVKRNSRIQQVSPNIKNVEWRVDGLQIISEEGQSYQAHLGIVAERSQSFLGALLKPDYEIDHDYPHTVRMALVEWQNPRPFCAWQVFGKQGRVISCLPGTSPEQGCLMLFLTPAEAMQWDRSTHLEQQEHLFDWTDGYVGPFTPLLPFQAYPLKKRLLKHFNEQGLLWIGDAAHTLHPMAGQGLNLGLQELAHLSRHIPNCQKATPAKAIQLIDHMAEVHKKWAKKALLGLDVLYAYMACGAPAVSWVRGIGWSCLQNVFLQQQLVHYAHTWASSHEVLGVKHELN